MRDPEAFGRLSQVLGTAARNLIACLPQVDNLANYIPLIERFPNLFDEPDKSIGFALINNNTWLPKPLVDARLKNQRYVARQSEKHIIWTRR